MNIDKAEQFGNKKLLELKLADWKLSVLPDSYFRRLERLGGTHGLVGLTMPPSKHIILRKSRIERSPNSKVKKIILHEIAHALRGTGFHDAKFRRIARKIGGYVKSWGYA